MKVYLDKNLSVDLKDALPVTLGDMCALEARGVNLTDTTTFKMSTIRIALQYFVDKALKDRSLVGDQSSSVDNFDVETAGQAFRFIMTGNKKNLNPN